MGRIEILNKEYDICDEAYVAPIIGSSGVHFSDPFSNIVAATRLGNSMSCAGGRLHDLPNSPASEINPLLVSFLRPFFHSILAILIRPAGKYRVTVEGYTFDRRTSPLREHRR